MIDVQTTSDPKAPALFTRALCRTFGTGDVAVRALVDVSLSVAAGEFVVILGASGSGKTTLLNIVGAIDHATKGSVIAAGVDLSDLDTNGRSRYRRCDVGFVFQFFNLVPTLTALENVQLIADLTGGDSERRSMEVLEAVGLAGRIDYFPSALSGGEQQRVAIARALVKEPPLLLCDEPTGSLDLDTGRRVLGLLRGLNRQDGRTVLVVTHNSEIARMADRVVRLGDGRIVQDEPVGTPVEAEDLQW